MSDDPPEQNQGGHVEKVLLDVIMPVYNEMETIEEIVRRVLAVEACHKLIIVDDGSTDGTRDILRTLDSPKVEVIYHEVNQGKTGAIRTGLDHVTGNIVIIQDADLEYNPQDYRQIVAAFQDDEALDAVYGSRYMNENVWLFWFYWTVNWIVGKPGERKSRFLINQRSIANTVVDRLRRLTGRTDDLLNRRAQFKFYNSINLANFYGTQFLTFLANVLYGLRLTDEATCYKAIKADVMKQVGVESEGFDFCPEMTAKLARRNSKIGEVSIEYSPRKVFEGKKIRLRDGWSAIWTLIKYRFRQS